MPRTPAERNDDLVKEAARRYVAMYQMAMAYLGQGGRTPGVTVPSAAQLRQHFESTNPQYWMSLPPDEQQSQLQQWKGVA